VNRNPLLLKDLGGFFVFFLLEKENTRRDFLSPPFHAAGHRESKGTEAVDDPPSLPFFSFGGREG